MEFNPSTFHQSDAFQKLPPEMCKMIVECLKKVGTSQDLLNLSKAYKRFEMILHPTMMEWKFHLVCPFIVPYLTGEEILNCRRVCKSWRRDMDTTLSEFDAWQPFDKRRTDISRSDDYDPLQMKNIKWTTFTKTESIQEYLSEMVKQPMKMTFVGGSLALKEPEVLFQNSNTFWEKSMELLLQCGTQLKHLLLKPSNIEPQQFFFLFGKMLKCTSNLKTLEFDGHYTINVTDCTDTKKKTTALLNYLMENPLPRVSSLHSLDICLLSNHFSVQVFQKLINDVCPSSLKSLKLNYSRSDVEMYDMFSTLHHIVNLTELHLIDIKNEEELDQLLESVVAKNVPIEKLVIEFDDYINDIDFDRVCNAINKLKLTLTVLVIGGVQYDRAAQCLSIRNLDTPNLKNLEIDGLMIDDCFQFSVLSNSLEYLHVKNTNRVGNVFRFFQWLLSYMVDGWPWDNRFWGRMQKLKVTKINVLEEYIMMTRSDKFLLISFRNQNENNYLVHRIL